MRSLRALRTIAAVTAAPLLLATAGLVHPRHLTAATAGHWAGLHIALLPVFPFLAVGLLVPLWGRPHRNGEGALTVLAWAGCLCYATYYSGLDAVAGISAGTVVDHGVHGAAGGLFRTGDELGRVGVHALAVAVVATCAALWRRHGARVLPGTVVLLAACWSFLDSHIFWPRGVFTMLGFAVGFVLLTLAAPRSGKTVSAAGSKTICPGLPRRGLGQGTRPGWSRHS
ncbi:hypothetical protein [Streptomyces botrytidirepellens]|uniref:hypothetical protein n=1 Tax=Streptomyces botrytidirepellens TaxID=2486417 RepID=UPI001FE851A5|nr:hypothetical protein [Streptomyces botrytidirepellens]